MAELPQEYSNYGTPTVVIELKGGLIEIKYKSEGCILIIEDYDAMDSDQDPDDLEERRMDADSYRTNRSGEEYQMERWPVDQEGGYLVTNEEVK